MSTPAVPDPQNLRASDADRERTAEGLRQAAGDGRLTMDELDERLGAVYAAKTYAELAPITRDLPADQDRIPAARPAYGGDPDRFGAEVTSHTGIAILGGFSRRGDWVVPKDFNAFMFMGGAEIDLREARFETREVNIHVVAIMGGCEIIVPEDATVRVTGIGIMGAFDHAKAGPGTPDGPVITVNGVAFMGGVSVERRPSTEAMQAARQQRLEERRARHDAHRELHQARRQERDLRRYGTDRDATGSGPLPAVTTSAAVSSAFVAAMSRRSRPACLRYPSSASTRRTAAATAAPPGAPACRSMPHPL